MQRYSDDFFISKLRKEGDMSVYRFARTFGIHQNTVQNRLNDLANRGLINRVSVTPEKFGPRPNEDKITEHPTKEQKSEFFSNVLSFSPSQTQKEILEVVKKYKEMSIVQIMDVTGYSRNTIKRNILPLEENGIVTSNKKGSHVCISIIERKVTVPPESVKIVNNEQRAMLSIGSLLSIIKNAFTDLESQVNILSAQNEALKNTMENNTKPPIIDEETIRSDERNRVFASLSNIMKLSPGIIAEWYKAGKDR